MIMNSVESYLHCHHLSSYARGGGANEGRNTRLSTITGQPEGCPISTTVDKDKGVLMPRQSKDAKSLISP